MIQAQLTEKLNTLENATCVLLNHAETFPEAARVVKPSPDVWSPIEVVYHLYLSERMSQVLVQRFLSSGKKASQASLKSTIGMWKLRIGNLLPVQINAPGPVAKIPPNLQWDHVREEWFVQRRDLQTWLGGLPDEVVTSTCFRHPIAGDISLVQMLDFFLIHLNRHELQIRKRLKA
ncbi:MAG: DinB family protein [Bacteroidetes Order II. Incertae sedis bacterium]|nr:DinB family protein [Bacteroidetes Order II. bacterium]